MNTGGKKMIKKIMSLMLMLLIALPIGALAQVQKGMPIMACPVDGQGNVIEPCPFPQPAIDVVFVIDSTGSMQDEIRQVKTHIKKIVKEVESGYPRPDLRIGIVTYRDHAPEEYGYVTQYLDLTSDIDRALNFLGNIDAQGGGDHPEAVADGLYDAIHSMNWRDYSIQSVPAYETQKLIFLIGDAAPHGVGSSDSSFEQGCPDGHNYKESIEEAQIRGIRIFTVSGSGMDYPGVRVWQDIAEETGGSYFELSYQRVDVDQYYKSEGLPASYAEEARSDADYDRSSNTILVNPFASFGSAKMMAAAESAGVSYDDPVEDEPEVEDSLPEDPEDGWLSPITGGVTGGSTASVPSNSLVNFFKTIFTRIAFWNR
jgi:Mg-chelatase subunit ChlD